MQQTPQQNLEDTVQQDEKENEKEKRHRTGFSAWKRRSDCASTGEWLRSGYESFTQDGIGAGFVDHALNVVGFAGWGITTAKLYPILMQYLPLAEKASQLTVSVPDLPLKLDQILESAAEGAVYLGAQGAEAMVAGIGALTAGYITFLAFDWLGDDYRPQRIAGWVWDHSGKWLWERTGQRAITGVKNGAKKAGHGLKYRALKVKDRFTKGRSAEDYDIAHRFDEAKDFIDKFPSQYQDRQEGS